jgi:2-polyprenyl-3-methyl-5-hydroxy-6-metoxy-1,4-benzoquinol methylase
MTAIDTDYAARLTRERAFHNDRFAHEHRQAQQKFYAALGGLETRMMQSIEAAARDADVLEYGCAKGVLSLALAPVARSVHGIDISDVAIDQATAQARARGAANVSFTVADAMDTGLPANSYDVIFGSGIIHHLDTRRSLEEIYRLLKPGGVAIFKEPLGENIAIRAYRAATPRARTVDEHPLVRRDLQIADAVFDAVDLSFYGLVTLAAVPLRGSALFRPVFGVTAALDRLLLRLPGLQWQAWYALMTFHKAAA